MVRESLLHYIPSENCENTTIKFWSLLYSSQFYYVHVPPGLSEKSREIVMSYLNSGLEPDKVTQTLIFKDLGVNSTKGQLISECLFEKIVWTKIPTKNLIDSAQQV